MDLMLDQTWHNASRKLPPGWRLTGVKLELVGTARERWRATAQDGKRVESATADKPDMALLLVGDRVCRLEVSA